MHRSVLLVATLLVFAAFAPGVGAAAVTAESPAGAASGGVVGGVTDGEAVQPADHNSETCGFPYNTTDATGADVNLTSDPERIVTLNPSAAQTMWEIGAREEVVGVSQYAGYLDGADEKVNVSGPGGPSVETVLNATPDLVLVPSSSYGAAEERVEQIRTQGVPVYVFGQPTSLEYVADKTERIGRLTGNCEAGTARAAEIRQSVDDMERALDGAERPVGLNVFYGYTSGANTFIGDLMTSGGLQNGAAENFTGFQMINDEAVVQINPEWIVVPEGSSVPETAAYETTTAVQEGNVIRIDTNLLQQPAPRSIRAAETILQRVHPEAYEEYRALQGESTAETTTAAMTEEPAATTAASPTSTSTGTPGFGFVVATVALAAAALLSGRR